MTFTLTVEVSEYCYFICSPYNCFLPGLRMSGLSVDERACLRAQSSPPRPRDGWMNCHAHCWDEIGPCWPCWQHQFCSPCRTFQNCFRTSAPWVCHLPVLEFWGILKKHVPPKEWPYMWLFRALVRTNNTRLGFCSFISTVDKFTQWRHWKDKHTTLNTHHLHLNIECYNIEKK